MPAGRPKEFTPKVIEDLLDKFMKYIEETEIPIIAEFAYKNGTHRQRLYEIEEFSDAIRICTSKKQAVLETLALRRKVNPAMAIFSLKQLGWKERVDHTTDDKQIKTEFNFNIKGSKSKLLDLKDDE